MMRWGRDWEKYRYEGWHGVCYVACDWLVSTTGKGKQTKEKEMIGLTTDAKRVRQLSGQKLEAIEWETRKPAVTGANQREYVSEMGYLAQRELNRRARRRAAKAVRARVAAKAA